MALLVLAAGVLFAPASWAETAVLNGHPVYYTDTGVGEKTLILVHGWGGRTTFWDGQIDALAEKNRVIALDLPGHGRSSAQPRAYTQAYFAAAIKAVMDKAKVDKAVLVGHSMSASTVRWAAKLYPKRVAGLVLIDGVIYPMSKDKAKRQEWLKEMKGFIKPLKGPDGKKALIDFLNMLHTENTPQEVKDAVEFSVLKTQKHVRMSALDNLFTIEAMDLPPIDVPTLALYVRNADLPPDFEAQMRPLFPNMTYVEFEDAGHFMMMEQPDDVNEKILEFVEKL